MHGTRFSSDISDLLRENVQLVIKRAFALNKDFREDRFRAAFEFAKKAHEGQLRKDGAPYITHPVEAAVILSEFFGDEETLIATLLHDVPEDTSHNIEEIEELFGTPVAFLVDGITKLSKVHYQNNMEQRQIESLKKLLLHTARDPRVIIIKLADRLHNMRTLKFVDKPEKRMRISRETLEIYVPMANLLGMQRIKAELQDLCFQHLYDNEYKLFQQQISLSEKKTSPLAKQTIRSLEEAFASHRLSAEISQRNKNFFSIFKKIQSEKKNIHDLHDVVTLRIIVKDIDDCYKALGIIHNLFRPKTGRFKDHIALPKINGYRSLHTTVFGIKGVLTEFQIRTPEMHQEAEFGIAFRMPKKHREFWMDQILAFEKEEKNSRDFVADVKGDVFQDRIFVFTPKGDTIYLPKGSTGIDFAYAVHSDVGNQAVSMKINERVTSLTAPVHSGDTIIIVTSPDARGPEYEWLSFAQTTTAKTRIREFLKKDSRRTKIHRGRMILQKAFDRAGLGSVHDIQFKKLQKLFQDRFQKKITHLNDVFYALAEGDLQPLEVIDGIFTHQQLKAMRRKSFVDRIMDRFSGAKKKATDIVEVRVAAKDRTSLVKDVVTVLSQFSLNIIKIKAWAQKENGYVLVTLELDQFNMLNTICSHLEQIDGVFQVERIFFGRQISFILGLTLTVCFWLLHPFALHSFLDTSNIVDQVVMDFSMFGGVALMAGISIYLHVITNRFFASFHHMKKLWTLTFIASIFALATVLGEIYYYRTYFHSWFVIFSGLLSIVFYLGLQFFQYRRIKKSGNA